ncbi:MAG: hypothetical protein AB7O32_16845 [Vicinamibacterales bacterium]
MRKQVRQGLALTVAMALGAALTLSVTRTSGQAARPARTPDNHPNFNGIWQALNEANWDLEAHEARAGSVMQKGVYDFEYAKVPAAPALPFGSAGGVPASMGVVDGDGKIPYKPEALKKKQDNADHWLERDPELKCYLPGIPRAIYLPYPFEIVQSAKKVEMAFAFSNGARTIHLDDVDPPPDDLWMGHATGKWEGDTLVVDVSHFNDKTWLDRAGNFHTDKLHVVERYSPISPDAIRYEATIEDPEVFARPWKISMPIYRRLEPNLTLLEYRCVEFVEEFLYGNLRRNQLVKTWDSETIRIDITRKVPEGEKLYDRYGR